jgi:RNA polymerase sigma-70 factor (ECF subfamily)
LDDSDELLRRCQRGDETALAQLVRRYEDRIFRLAYRVTGDAALAEEATADALAKVWTKSGQWRGDAQAGTWIYRLAVRTVLDGQRRRRRWWRFGTSPPEDTLDPRPGPPEQAAEQERREQLSRLLGDALRQLAEGDRVLVHLYYFEQRGLPEIEALMGVARETLKMRLARARQRLRGFLKGFDESS